MLTPNKQVISENYCCVCVCVCVCVLTEEESRKQDTRKYWEVWQCVYKHGTIRVVFRIELKRRLCNRNS